MGSKTEPDFWARKWTPISGKFLAKRLTFPHLLGTFWRKTGRSICSRILSLQDATPKRLRRRQAQLFSPVVIVSDLPCTFAMQCADPSRKCRRTRTTLLVATAAPTLRFCFPTQPESCQASYTWRAYRAACRPAVSVPSVMVARSAASQKVYHAQMSSCICSSVFGAAAFSALSRV